MLERRDVASKSEANRILAQQRMQQGISASMGHGGAALSTENQAHPATQSTGGIGSHDGGNTHGQEPERSTAVESGAHTGNDQPMQQSSSSINDGGQNSLRRNGPLGFVASAASAFDAAKDIMEALRSKHTNLAGELEVIIVSWIHLLIYVSAYIYVCTQTYDRHNYKYIQRYLYAFPQVAWLLYQTVTLFNIPLMERKYKAEGSVLSLGCFCHFYLFFLKKR